MPDAAPQADLPPASGADPAGTSQPLAGEDGTGAGTDPLPAGRGTAAVDPSAGATVDRSPGAVVDTPTGLADHDVAGRSAAQPATAAPPPAEPEITDVWAWSSQHKYRRRATILLLVNLLLFCGLCIFTNWLHVGQPFQFDLHTYIDPLRFWGPQTHSLHDFILYPISVDDTPIYGVVIGLLLASIVAFPICVAILYRFRSALPFCAAVLIFAHMPWMAVTLLGSCILAAVRPFKMSFRFGSALLALLPVLLYLYLASRGATEPMSASTSPEQSLLRLLPWLLAILAACTMLAVMIFAARLVNYRPGIVAPVMAVMFATPAFLFATYIGVDQLSYRLLELEYGPRSRRFEPVQDASDRILRLVRDWIERGDDAEAQRGVVLALWSTRPDEQFAIKYRIWGHLLVDLLGSRQAAFDACRDFIADHPDSRFVPCVLFIQGRALDTRLDELQFIGDQAQRELYADFPHVQSEPVWTTLLTQYPESTLAVAARLRVAQLRLRKGDADGALAALTTPVGPRDAPATRRVLRSRSAESRLRFEAEPYLFEARRGQELIQANKSDPRYGTAPLQALAGLDPHRPGYPDQLARLASTYADALLYDNLVVRWAETEPERATRAAKLSACIERFAGGDAAPEAMFQLADLEVQTLGAGDETRRATGIARYRDLVARFGSTCWGQAAGERLKTWERPLKPTTDRAVSP